METMTECSSIHIDISSISEFTLNELLVALTEPLRAFYADPENQKKYEAWLAERQAAGQPRDDPERDG